MSTRNLLLNALELANLMGFKNCACQNGGQDPLPIGNWQGVFNATLDGPACIQIPAIVETGTIGAEDCLWLSVYTPSLVPESKLPVVVWIHGGRWSYGSGRQSSYGPHQLIDRGVVVIHVQYRLGALGWLSTQDSVAPGNYGFNDQVLALKWIKSNVHSFGGDPDRITLLGHSAGGASAHGHIISPLSNGLFQRAISISGATTMAWAGQQNNHGQIARRQAQLVGCPIHPSQALIECLRTVDAVTLTASASGFTEFFPDTAAKLPFGVYSPRVDVEADYPFWPLDPTEALALGEFNKDIPWMTGITSMESSAFSVELFGKIWEDRLAFANDNLNEVFKHLFTHPGVGPQERDAIWDFYFNNKEWNRTEHRIRVAEMMSDSLFNFEELLGVYLQSRQSLSNIYLYKFNYIGSWGYVNMYGESPNHHGGVAHLDDVRYIMSMPWAGPHNEEDKRMVKLYTSMIGNFIRSGNPSLEQNSWLPFRPGRGRLLNFNSPFDAQMSRCLPFPLPRLSFWRQILNVPWFLHWDYLTCSLNDETSVKAVNEVFETDDILEKNVV
ncbi:esterase FE4-like isoform X2 [Tigriopus californicus]|uniref:esterase FE4-like isoform X2 n=1 Tax=Tigriopus californicus TaxID=6832 RepID=UPI0027DAA44D|nr:esterase FE4-like isoform X2 [Tigriopus californicus]